MTRAKLTYWLFLAALTGAVFVALVGTALGFLLAAAWAGVTWLYRRWTLRPTGA